MNENKTEMTDINKEVNHVDLSNERR